VSKQVFLMDDSAFALDLLRTALLDDGFAVTCGRDLADLTRLSGTKFDLVLMDVDMPEAFGDDVTSWLVAEGLNTPVYLLSSIPANELARRAEDCGAHGFISKRDGIEAVVARVHAVLQVDAPAQPHARSPLIDVFVATATARLRRAHTALADGALAAIAHELHTLAGEAGLLGLTELAELAEACRVEAVATSGDPAERAIALRGSLSTIVDKLADVEGARVPVVPVTEHSGRLLLLDDSDLYRSTLMGLLESAGYEVVEARRLSEARQRMRDRHYDLAILDLQLEDGSGSELIPELREHAPATRLLLLSGNTERNHAADLMLPKSVDPAELLRRIDELLSA
jgi:DNA-binding response OmpR family regulator